MRGEMQREKEAFVEENGRELHKKLITTFNGRHKVPIRIFTAEELIRATNNFTDPVNWLYYQGSLEQRPISVKKVSELRSFSGRPISVKNVPELRSYCGRSEDIIHDIVISSQMSHHKNVWKLLGCCLEFEYPALVYEYDNGFQFLEELLDPSKDNGIKISSWKSRLKIANDIANAVAYLHMAFPSPFIYRTLGPSNIIIDQHGVAKLFDFSMSIALPPGELQVLDDLRGTCAHMDPDHISSGFVSQKTDVYGFGILLLALLTGRTYPTFEEICAQPASGEFMVIDEIVDSKTTGEGEGEGIKQLKALQQLALKCIQYNKEDRPEMLEVARELRQITKYSRSTNPNVLTSSPFTCSVSPAGVDFDTEKSKNLEALSQSVASPDGFKSLRMTGLRNTLGGKFNGISCCVCNP